MDSSPPQTTTTTTTTTTNPQQEPPNSEEGHRSPTNILTTPLLLQTASITLSLSSFISSLHLRTPKPLSSPSHLNPSHLRIPSQITSILLSPSPNPSLRRRRCLPSRRLSSTSSLPLPSPLLPLPYDPSHPAAARRCTIVWFRSDLRLHDHEPLSSASSDSLSLLPLFLFDPRDFGRSPSGFDKTGPYRASFLLQSVADLRRSLRDRGSDLVVRVGRPETVLPELARAVGADGLYAHREVSHDEVRAEESAEQAMEKEGVEVKYFWGSTLHHIDDLPFEVEEMPSNYGGFRDRVQGLAVRKTIEPPEQVKGLPSRGNVEVGEIPTLADLGLKSPANSASQNGKFPVSASLVGGETEALQRLKKFTAECRTQPNKDSNKESIFGANFSCKISPWLATGCLSPRFMFDELKKTISRGTVPKNGGISADSRMNWLMFELLWRDFFRFITKKYSSRKREHNSVPATACV